MRIGVLSIGVLLLAAACGDASSSAVRSEPGGALVLVTADPADPTRTRLEGRMSAVHAARPLETGLASAWAPRVTHDAARLCFLGRAAPGDDVALYVSDVDGTGAVSCGVPVDEASAPAWLPDGHIVYAAPAPDGSRALFVIAPPAGTPRRITFCGMQAADPLVLKDGRILYVGTSFEHSPAGAPALFTVHPDGSGVTLFHAQTKADRYRRPRQASNGDVLFLADGPAPGVYAIDWRAPEMDSLRIAVPAGTVAVEALTSDDRIALSRPNDGAPPRLARLAADGTPGTLDAGTLDAGTLDAGTLDPGTSAALVDLCVAEARPRPQGHLSMVREEADRGRVLCLDARPAGSGPRGVAVRLHAQVTTEREARWRSLGKVALAADGSFFVGVPADVPLRLDVLDAEGGVLSSTRTPFWVRPNEVRGCVGCHAPSDATPPNRMPQAGLRDPLELDVSLEMGAAR